MQPSSPQNLGSDFVSDGNHRLMIEDNYLSHFFNTDSRPLVVLSATFGLSLSLCGEWSTDVLRRFSVRVFHIR